MTDPTPTRISADLARLGDDLESAIGGDLARRHAPRSGASHPSRRRKAVVVAALGVAGALAASGAVAAAMGAFSHDEVERGMPNGATMFRGTHPSCTEVEPGVVFHCTVPGGPDKSVESLDSYKGTIEVLSSDDLVVSGGCRGQDVAGTKWICYVGQRAVDEGMISQDFLGTKQQSPGGVG